MPNPYLTSLRSKYDEHRKSIEGLQTRAADEKRDLTEDELRSVKEQADQAKTLATQIEDLTEIETRNAKVADLAGRIAEGTKTTSDTTANDRDPGHYRSVKEGGRNSFFGDLYRSKFMHDGAAFRRLDEHARALEPTAEGPGIIPPKWMADEFAELARQGRRIADVVRHLPITDSRPIPMGKQTAGTDSVVVDMGSSESATTTWTDAYDTDKDTLTPTTTSGGQEFRRELLDSSSPAIDALVYGDLLAAYNAKVETKVATAIFAAGPADLTYDAEAATSAVANNAFDQALKASLAVRTNRKLPATGLVMPIDSYGVFLSLKDTTGRPVMPAPQVGAAVNVMGVGSVQVDGIVQNLPVFASDGVPGANALQFAAVRLSDVILAESSVLRFYDEQTKGPEVIRLAVWGYTGVLVRYASLTVQVVADDA